MARYFKQTKHLWRGSLLPLDCEAGPITDSAISLKECIQPFAAATRPSGSKLPRHKSHRILQAAC